MTMDRRRMLIGGQLVESDTGKWLDSIDPATEEHLGSVPAGSAADIERAVAAAQDAGGAWAGAAVEDRAAALRTFAQRLLDRADEILELEVRDTGNTVRSMRRDVDRAAAMVRYHAGLGLEIKGETVPATPGNLHFSVREPYGVVGRIVPFNHPVMFAASRLAAPLVTGNTLVLKPSEQSPLSTAVLAEICQELFPPGVVNIVTGTGVVGEALVRHPEVRRLAFIGSPRTGRAIQRAAAEVAVKHVTLELGGKNPLIAFPDVTPDRVATAAVAGMNFGHQGQSCGSTSRLFVHASMYEEVLERVVTAVAELKVGDPMNPSTDMGPLNSAAHRSRVGALIDEARRSGARLLTGGERPQGDRFSRGFWLEPTVFADVRPGMTLFEEEVFGPVLSVTPWTTTDEVIDMANGTRYGLTASVWTNDLAGALDAVRRLHAGYIWLNGTSSHFLGCAFGGTKDSGVGTEEGIEELYSYTQSKTVHVLLNRQ